MARRPETELEHHLISAADFKALDKEGQKRVLEIARRQVLIERRKLDLLSADRCANNLEQFVKEAWPVMYGARPLQWNWHLSVGCEMLQALKMGQINRALFCWPPRTLKSNIVSVFFPCFVWATDPEEQFLSFSHKGSIAARDAGRSRRLMMTDWYLRRFGKKFYFTADQNAKDRYVNSRGGHRISQGILSGFVGEDADYIIVDDPSDPKKLMSEKNREKLLEEIWPDIQLRLNNQLTGKIIVMLQRTHEADLAGHVIDNDTEKEYTKVIFPLEFERDHPNRCDFDIRKKEGELLFPARFTTEYVDKLKRNTNAYIYSGRFQQRPSLRGGNILMRNWWQVWQESDLPSFEIIIISVDTAFEEGQENDYTACTIWGLWKPNPKAKTYQMMLIHAWRERRRYGDMKAKVLATIQKWTIDDQPPDHVIIEKKASGQSLLQDFADAGIEAFGYNPGKESLVYRANVMSDVLEDGIIWVPGKPTANNKRSDKILATWAEPVIREAERFPKDDHDDFVATIIQAFHFAADTGYIESSLDLPLHEYVPPSVSRRESESIYG